MKHLRLKFLIDSNLNFPIWHFAWGLANDHDIYKKYETFTKHIIV